ncbi:hypothetical protein GCM10011490_09010 [Pseudoclavibacter endophyticus]|uniref:hypothetical protein n=1 Tax=Pseudoclavibacter endophyticus TaxID=1778590 RepID=UPI00166C54F4|nr:hypothetical protein [Pseudoclavibacter endophyticus]GGA61023.1 hypothetical protein GCM10011490_09010 [Pseudoclavibacter endophyticus]
MTAPAPTGGPAAIEVADDAQSGSSELDPAAARAVAEHLFDRGWTDGLPTLPATEDEVERFLAHTDRDPDEILARLPQLDKQATVRDITVHAIMAGCRPEYLPVVLTAWEALSADRTAIGGAWQSTSGPSPVVIVNGPIRQRLELNSAGGIFGPGFRPNATIPRAIGLTVRNSLGVVPHELEQATQGVPGRWAQCFGEAEERSPWESFATELGLDEGADAVSVILARTSEFVDNRHFNDPIEVLRDFADSMQRTGPWIFPTSACLLVLNPDHARVLAEAGWSKQDVREWLVEHAGKTEAQLAAVGKALSRGDQRFDDDHFHPVFAEPTPEHLPIVVGGSPNAAISMVVRVFSRWPGKAFRIH